MLDLCKDISNIEPHDAYCREDKAPIKNTEQIRLVQPMDTSPKHNFLITLTTRKSSARNEIVKPRFTENLSGLFDWAVISSKAIANFFENEYEDDPAKRSSPSISMLV